ncbi:cytochrome c biogenesis protein CcsA [Bacillus horti]|uniref:ABC-type transport system involved in cytochrome c biogenesis permease subunit n=1 Tax=Caldalkalibacillus horti TaxID=77523 RepID=A0ABT9VUA2_9BACI|nr:cytochrome c biogenesis protein CcsA [Bacillus horti]MDQ0164566.1 ABC-type transport system involved in cytochrome c biogenesis permease subunit [Bacillus horti]
MNLELISLSSTLLLITFFVYIISGVVFVISILGRKWSDRDPETHKKRWGKAGFIFACIGFLFHLGYFITRWIGVTNVPLSNMFEYMVSLAMMTVFGFIILYAIYRTTLLGILVLPLAITLLGWASVFDSTPNPLVPSLQSHWLTLHVSFVSLSQGIFAIAFAAGLMYIIRTVNQSRLNKQNFFLEVSICAVLMLVGFIIVTSTFRGMGYEVSFEYINEREESQVLAYTLPAIAGPQNPTILSPERMEPIISTPGWMKGVDAPRKFNTLIWSFLSGLVLYGLLLLIFRKRLGAVMQPWLSDIKPAMLDEMQYRAIAIAYPLFTLGGLIFAMIWAEQAWGRFWGWDPKEVWALITWLLYSAYLHLRLSKGWHGTKSAWLGVIGFVIIMFNLVFVNLIIAGLHSYASGG